MGYDVRAGRAGRLWAPLNVIRETQAGWDQQELIYPGISSCTSITMLLASGELIGTHLTFADSADDFQTALIKLRTRTNGNVREIYHVGKMRAQGHGWNTGVGLSWPEQAATLRKKMGALNARSFACFLPQHGYDVRMQVVNNAVVCAARPESRDPWTDGWATLQPIAAP